MGGQYAYIASMPNRGKEEMEFPTYRTKFMTKFHGVHAMSHYVVSKDNIGQGLSQPVRVHFTK